MFEPSVLGVVGVASRVRDAATTLASDTRTCASWTAADRSAALACVRAAEAALAEARAHLLVAARSTGELERPGDRSFENALGRSTRSGSVEATRQVRQADALVSMPSVAAGVREGLVPLGHLDTLARVAATAAPEVAASLRTPASQDRVVQMAQTLSAPDFAKSLAQYVASKDPAALETAFETQRRERFLTISVQAHGAFLKGRLDTTAAESLRVALDLMDQHPDDHRSPGQASADALVLLAERAGVGTIAAPTPGTSRADSTDTRGRDALLGGGDTSAARSGDQPATRAPGSLARPHLSLLVPAETFVELIRHQHALDRVGDAPTEDLDDNPGPDPGDDQLELGITPSTRGASPARLAPVLTPPWSSVAPWNPVSPATLEDGTPVPMSELARALCDADITRIVISAEGLPLDVGRAKRLFTPAMRRAAVARDQQCTWNGCTTPASRCEMHHLRWWDKHHGATSLTNAALLCGHHHRLVHQLDLTIQRLAQPPGWVARQRTADQPTDPTTPGIDGQPMRYVLRDPANRVVSAPEGWPGSG